ncbi:DDE-type integrase/transposase/recombinase [Streptomyces sp. NPDC005533]|uniref:DDE-type integrase/transposase/recombinase n=1 Tax=Streptomyces sp. NPDC005533 TaxID=3364723 RepID=UPI0036969A12
MVTDPHGQTAVREGGTRHPHGLLRDGRQPHRPHGHSSTPLRPGQTRRPHQRSSRTRLLPHRRFSKRVITYVKTAEGWLYLATVIDCCTKEVIGYAMDDHYQTPLISQAIHRAARNRKLAKNAIFRSDRGSNYMSAEFGDTLKLFNLRRSAGRTGICFDNAMAESFFGALKNE